MGKKVLVSTTNVHINNILNYHNILNENDSEKYDKLNDSKFGNRFLNGSVVLDEDIFTDDVLASLPKEYVKVLDLPDGYEVLSDSGICGDEQFGLIIAKDITYVDTSNDILPEEECNKIKELIVPIEIDE